MPSDVLGIILLSGTHDRAHYAFVIAAGAAAVGRSVVIFATNLGCQALFRDWSGLAASERDAIIEARGVAGLETLRNACLELDVKMIACEAGLRAEALDQSLLLPNVRIAGITTFLAAVNAGQVITI